MIVGHGSPLPLWCFPHFDIYSSRDIDKTLHFTGVVTVVERVWLPSIECLDAAAGVPVQSMLLDARPAPLGSGIPVLTLLATGQPTPDHKLSYRFLHASLLFAHDRWKGCNHCCTKGWHPTRLSFISTLRAVVGHPSHMEHSQQASYCLCGTDHWEPHMQPTALRRWVLWLPSQGSSQSHHCTPYFPFPIQCMSGTTSQPVKTQHASWCNII